MQDPFYDKGSQYTVPYTIYTTGIGYRTDKVDTTPWDLDNPYEIYWDERNKGKTYLLDDGREAPIHMLLKNGITDTNTEKPEDIDLAKSELKSLTPAVNVKLSTDDYTNVPEGRAWVHQMWSGSAVSAQWYLPEGTGPEVLGYWYPDRRGRRDRKRHDGRPAARRRTPFSRTTSSTSCSTRRTGTRTSRSSTATSRRSPASTLTASSRTAWSRRT